KSGDNYIVDFIGFNTVVSAGSSKVLTVKVDAYNTIDTAYASGGGSYASAANRTISLATDGVRGVDGAGINQNAGTTSVSRAVTFSKSTADNATLVVSTNVDTPKASDAVASEGTDNDELD